MSSSVSKRAWRTWAQAALEDGARRAQQWMKGPHPFKALGLIEDGVYGVAPLRLLRSMATKLRKAWVTDDPRAEKPLLDMRPPPEERRVHGRIDGDEVAQSALAESRLKVYSPCGFPPRHLGHSCRRGRRVTGILWMACQLVGILPPQAVECIAPLIPKPKGS